jgi:hypothetical protein
MLFLYSGFGPIPVVGGESAPAPASPSQELIPSPFPAVSSPADTVSSPVPRPKEGQADSAPTTSVPETQHKLNGEVV